MSTGVNISYRPLPNWRVSRESEVQRQAGRGPVRDPVDRAERTRRRTATRYLFGESPADRVLDGYALERLVHAQPQPATLRAAPAHVGRLPGLPATRRAAGSFDFLDYAEGRAYRFNGDVTGCTGRNDVRASAACATSTSTATASWTTRPRDRDFNIRSLRGNAVFRWEYRPGSATLSSCGSTRAARAFLLGNFDLSRDLEGLWLRAGGERLHRQGEPLPLHLTGASPSNRSRPARILARPVSQRLTSRLPHPRGDERLADKPPASWSK